jgi:hypothetical protein
VKNINKIDGETMVINTKEINEKLKNPSEFLTFSENRVLNQIDDCAAQILPPTYSFAGFTYAGGMQTLAALYLTASSQIAFISCQVAPCAKSVWSTFESMFCLFICVSLLWNI